MHEISKAILKFLKKVDWCTPKDIIAGVYPIFKNQYKEKDTFRRLVRRALKELVDSERIIKHDIQPYYHHADYQSMLSSRDSFASLSNFVEEHGIGHLPLSHILSPPILRIPIVKARDVDKRNRENLPLEIKVLYDYADGLSTIKIAKKYKEIRNKTEALALLREGIRIVEKSLFKRDNAEGK